MTVRYLVQDTFRIPGRGPVIAGVLQEGEIRNGDVLAVAGTGAQIRISFVEFHGRETPEGPLIGLVIEPEDAAAVTAGSMLVSTPET